MSEAQSVQTKVEPEPKEEAPAHAKQMCSSCHSYRPIEFFVKPGSEKRYRVCERCRKRRLQFYYKNKQKNAKPEKQDPEPPHHLVRNPPPIYPTRAAVPQPQNGSQPIIIPVYALSFAPLQAPYSSVPPMQTVMPPSQQPYPYSNVTYVLPPGQMSPEILYSKL